MWDQLQDMVLELAAYLGGGEATVSWLLNLPTPSLTSAYDSYARVYSRRSREFVYHNWVSSQGTGDSVSKLLEGLGAESSHERSNDLQKLISKMGKRGGS